MTLSRRLVGATRLRSHDDVLDLPGWEARLSRLAVRPAIRP
jgi:hypothetical protein